MYLKKFCWCLSLRVGCIIISFLKLVLGFIHMVEFFRLKEYNNVEVWLNLLWGILHFISSLCLSCSVLTTNLIPIFLYSLIEASYMIYAIIYASVSYALKTNVYANLGLEYEILFWIYIIFVCGSTVYFLFTAISFYLRKRKQRNNRES
ncbi:uncharacterized protein LOC110190015 [Drosophila serrata]|uniref:uncharacterized protein LOC110190015 n=1 Tax=Drosophila serrata TaxID=7274 RepID=UPI000A1D1FEC|nr:uncharacterized protein LOC110190015 [Drosophila serrata]